jgi:hypothetical protein
MIHSKFSSKTSRTTFAALMVLAITSFGFGLTPSPKPVFAAGCHPLSSSGHCYKAGQLCRQSDSGLRGIAINGSKIVCKNNNGMRWVYY